MYFTSLHHRIQVTIDSQLARLIRSGNISCARVRVLVLDHDAVIYSCIQQPAAVAAAQREVPRISASSGNGSLYGPEQSHEEEPLCVRGPDPTRLAARQKPPRHATPRHLRSAYDELSSPKESWTILLDCTHDCDHHVNVESLSRKEYSRSSSFCIFRHNGIRCTSSSKRLTVPHARSVFLCILHYRRLGQLFDSHRAYYPCAHPN